MHLNMKCKAINSYEKRNKRKSSEFRPKQRVLRLGIKTQLKKGKIDKLHYQN